VKIKEIWRCIVYRILSKDLHRYVGQHVRLAGWLHLIRRRGKINFLHLRDGWGITQVVIESEETLELIRGLLPESVLEVDGILVAEPQAHGGIEIHDPKITVISPVRESLPFPINKPVLKAHLDTFLDHAAIGLRHPLKRAPFRLAAGIMAAFRSNLEQKGFVEITTPKIVGTATESGADVFAIDYLGQKAYLAQSPQFYKQIMVGIFERVYEVGPVFRAEPHATARHLNEYISLDAEFGFIKDHTTVMGLLNEVIQGILIYLKTHYGDELSLIDVNLPNASTTFPSIYFPDAQQLIFDRFGEDCKEEVDLAPQHERWLGEWAKEEYESDFIFVTGYPMAKRPFYTHPNPADPRYSNSFDLLFRGVELVTGGQRLHRYEDYVAALQKDGLPLETFEGYLEAFRYGMTQHGGFAIGLERFLMQLLGLKNLREATLFPRDLKRLTP